MPVLVPRPLGPRSHVRVVAPSSPFDRALFLRGLGWLGERYRVTFSPSLFARNGFLAGTDERRQLELEAALLDPSVEAIVGARGGHGLLRILDRVPWDAIREAPKWLVGFSDLTALHAEAWQRGVASMHASMLTGLGRGDATARRAWALALEQPLRPRTLEGRPVVGGRVTGLLVGGNLTVLTMMAAAGRLRLPHACVLALEDVNESSYSIDRLLTALELGGHLRHVAGFALGEFLDCGNGRYRVPVDSVLRERLGEQRPIVGGLPFGHGRSNCPLIFSLPAILDGSSGTLTVAAV